MKKLFFICLFTSLFSGCSHKENKTESIDFSMSGFPQEWELYKTSGQIAGSEATGEEMERQETYTFNKDGSFSKILITDSGTLSGSGTFVIEQQAEETHFLLTYKSDNPIIGSCTSSSREESLTYDPKDNILFSNWWACDGPGLFYKRVK